VLSLVVSYSGVYGGAERLLVEYAPALDGERVVACPNGPLAAHARDAGLRVVALPERSAELRGSPRDHVAATLRLAGHAAEIRRLLRDLQPDLLVAWGMRSALSCAAVARGRGRPRAVVFQHNDLLPGPAVARAVRAAAGGFDCVITLSEAIARDLDPQRALGTRLHVCRPGVDLARFFMPPVPAGSADVLLMGAIVDWKRPELALEAVAGAAARLPAIRLRVAGAPLDAAGERLMHRLRARAAQPDLAGRVEVAGALDARDALAGSACLLHCADREPFGLVVVEAMAAGRPVVAPDGGGPAELVDDTVGRLYPPGEASAAADRLVEVLGRPGGAAALGAQARRRAEARHGADQARDLWRTAVGGPAAPPRPPQRGSGLALVTVTHDSEAELRALLDSVGRHLPGARVVVVDSGSADRSVPVARGWNGRATVIELGANVGFGAANNRGLEAVQEPVTALVNPDVELLDDSLALLAAEASSAERPERLLAPLVLLPDGRRQDSVHPLPTSAADLTRALVPPGALPSAVALPLAPWRASQPRRVGWAVGCSIVARTDTLRRLGPFDERFFMYAEDLDLGLRAGASGIETWFWPAGRVLHHRAHSSERAFGGEAFDMLARMRHQAVARNRGERAARVDDAAQLATFAGRMALKRLLRRPWDREARQLRAVRNARRGPPPES